MSNKNQINKFEITKEDSFECVIRIINSVFAMYKGKTNFDTF